ncbi:Uncharacterised protein [Burkholderia oklahomensis]|nr:hypothetical protein BG90_1533 [Burkholderia oklahomensis C6786]SUW58970.1 Uncharacterised protein [Burkholderia oklahomensis]
MFPNEAAPGATPQRRAPPDAETRARPRIQDDARCRTNSRGVIP